jgi:hypothetical protein
VSFCSAKVVGPRHLVTAAHCATGAVASLDWPMARAEKNRARGDFSRVFAAFGPKVADAAVVEVAWTMPRSDLPGILARDAIVEDDLDADYFSDWNVNPFEASPEEVDTFATSRDIAAVLLEGAVPPGAIPVRIAAEAAQDGEELVALGYGLDAPQALPSGPFAPAPSRGEAGVLAELRLRVGGAGTCDAPIVAARALDASAALCNGDSGGPLFRRTKAGDELVGVVSAGGCVEGVASFGEARFTDARHHVEFLTRAFAHLEQPLALEPSAVQCEAPLVGDRDGDPALR